jgi:hypothetical protein
MKDYTKNYITPHTKLKFDLCNSLMNVVDEILGDATLREPYEMLRDIVDQYGSTKEPFFKFVYAYYRDLNIRFAFNSLMVILPYETKLNLLRYAETTWSKEQYIFSRIKKILMDNSMHKNSHSQVNLLMHQQQNNVINFILGERKLTNHQSWSLTNKRSRPSPEVSKAG